MVAMLEFLPKWLSPEIIPGLPFRWYGFMYLIAFGVTWLSLSENPTARCLDRRRSSNFFIWDRRDSPWW